MDMDSLAIIVKAILSLKDVTDSKKQIESELPDLEKKLQSDKNAKVKIIAGLDIDESRKVIQSQIDVLSSQLSGNTVKIGLDVTKNNGIQNVINDAKKAQKQVQQIFKIDDLKSNNIPYMSKAYNTVEKQMERIKSLAKSQDWELIDVKGVEECTGKVKQLELTIKDAEGTLKKFIMQREKLQGNGKAQYGFVQIGDVKILEIAEKAQEKLNVSIEKAQTNLTNLEQKWEKQGILTGEFKNQVESLKTELSNVDDAGSLDKYNASLKLAQDNAEGLLYSRRQNIEVEKQLTSAISELNKIQNSSTFSKNSFNPQVSQTKQEVNELKNEYQKLLNVFRESPTPQNLENIKQKLAELDDRFDKTTSSAKAFETQLKSDNSAEKLTQKVQLLTQQIKAYQEVNTKASKTYGSQFSEILDGLTNPDIDEDTYNRLYKKYQVLRQEISATGKTGKTFFENLKAQAEKFSSWMSLTGVITELWRGIKQMVTNVIELDSAMTNLKKVTDKTEASYSKFLKNSIQQARDLKIDLSDLVNQTAEWAKKGYGLNDAAIASKASGIYSVVGEVDDTTAVQDITTVMKSYNMTVEETIDIVDKFNNISNKYSVSAADIGEMLSNSISSLSIAGNTLDQAIAMGTTITEVTGDASEAGNTLKVLSMRLRGASTEIEAMGESTDGMAESTSKLQSQIKALTNVDGTGGFDIMADANNFKSTYEIMQGIADVWEDMSDVNQAALIEIIAGKQRGNTVSALLTNMAQANNVLNDSLSSSGSAMREYETYLESIEGKIQGFETAFQSLSQTIVDDDFLKDIIETATNFVNILADIIEEVGVLPTLISSITAIGAFKNVGETKTKHARFLYSHKIYV